MAQIKGTNFKIYLDGDVVAYLKSNSLTRTTSEIDITNKESGGDKETMPGLREIACNCDGFIDMVAKNLLANSEDLESAQYSALATGSITATGVAGPTGENTGSTIDMPVALDGWEATVPYSVVNGTVATFSLWLKGASADTTQIVITSANTLDGSSLTVNVTTQWKRFSVSHTFTGNSTDIRIQVNRAVSGDMASVHAAMWQLETGDVLTTYQPTPRVLTKDLFDAIEDGTAYTATCDDKTTGHRKYSGTAYVKNLSQDFPNEDAAQFSCDLMFSGAITTTNN